MDFSPRNFIIVPIMDSMVQEDSIALPGENISMSKDVFAAAVKFAELTSSKQEDISLTFAGKEPLLMGEDFFAYALSLLRESFGIKLNIFIESDLRLLSDSMLVLLKRYDVNVIAELDGFKKMNDAQRGEGAYDNTMQAIRRLRMNGIEVKCACTFSSKYSDKAQEVFKFFAKERLPYSLRGESKAIDDNYLSPEDLGKVLLDTFMAYKGSINLCRVENLDKMMKSYYTKTGEQFFERFGETIAIAPDGKVYNHVLLCGQEQYAIYDVRDIMQKAEDISQKVTENPAFLKLFDKQSKAKEACKKCIHKTYCGGGDLYNIIAFGGDSDPYCMSYKTIFDSIVFLTNGEQKAVALAMGGDQHPFDKEVNLFKRKLALKLNKSPKKGFLSVSKVEDLYLNITYKSPAHCNYYIPSEQEKKMEDMPISLILKAVNEAAKAGVKRIHLTGNEPLFYYDLVAVLYELMPIQRKGTELLIETSLALYIEESRLKLLCEVFDKIIVRIDGSKPTHDLWHGAGTYEKALSNLKKIKKLGYIDKVRICSVLSKKQRDSYELGAVYELMRKLGAHDVLVRPTTPYDNPKNRQKVEDYISFEEEDIKSPFTIKLTCALGQELYIDPNGDAYASRALKREDRRIGNIQGSLKDILEADAFKELASHNVNTNEKCKNCKVRYLCGGMRKVWVQDNSDLDSGEFDCTLKKEQYMRMAELIEGTEK